MYRRILESFVAQYAAAVSFCNSASVLQAVQRTGMREDLDSLMPYGKEEAYNSLAVDMLAVAHYAIGMDGQLSMAEVEKFNEMFTPYGLTVDANASLEYARKALDCIGRQKQAPATLLVYIHSTALAVEMAAPAERQAVLEKELEHLDLAICFFAVICCEMAKADGHTADKERQLVVEFLQDCCSFVEQKLCISFPLTENAKKIVRVTFGSV